MLEKASWKWDGLEYENELAKTAETGVVNSDEEVSLDEIVADVLKDRLDDNVWLEFVELATFGVIDNEVYWVGVIFSTVEVSSAVANVDDIELAFKKCEDDNCGVVSSVEEVVTERRKILSV